MTFQQLHHAFRHTTRQALSTNQINGKHKHLQTNCIKESSRMKQTIMSQMLKLPSVVTQVLATTLKTC